MSRVELFEYPPGCPPPRDGTSRAKSDRGDAKLLADVVRTDRHNHRQVAGDTPAVEAVKVLARAHQSLIWARQRHVNALRSALREFYPGALAALGAQLAEPEALAVLGLAPTPQRGRQLTRAAVRRALVGAGRRRNLQARWWRSTTLWPHRNWPQLSRSRPPTVTSSMALWRC